MGEKMPGGSGPSAGAARLLFWDIGVLPSEPGLYQGEAAFWCNILAAVAATIFGTYA